MVIEFKTILTNLEKLKMLPKTDNFNHVSDPKLLCTCGHENCDQRSVDQSTLNKVQLVRNDANRGLIITSGGRCPYHPDELHRDKPADHQKCKGIDIKVSGGLQRGEIVNLGIKHGFNAIGVAKTFVHLGHRPESKAGEIMMWVY